MCTNNEEQYNRNILSNNHKYNSHCYQHLLRQKYNVEVGFVFDSIGETVGTASITVIIK